MSLGWSLPNACWGWERNQYNNIWSRPFESIHGRYRHYFLGRELAVQSPWWVWCSWVTWHRPTESQLPSNRKNHCEDQRGTCHELYTLPEAGGPSGPCSGLRSHLAVIGAIYWTFRKRSAFQVRYQPSPLNHPSKVVRRGLSPGLGEERGKRVRVTCSRQVTESSWWSERYPGGRALAPESTRLSHKLYCPQMNQGTPEPTQALIHLLQKPHSGDEETEGLSKKLT